MADEAKSIDEFQGPPVLTIRGDSPPTPASVSSLTDDSSGWRDASLSMNSRRESDIDDIEDEGLDDTIEISEYSEKVTLSHVSTERAETVHSPEGEVAPSPKGHVHVHVSFEEISLDETFHGFRKESLTEHRRKFSFFQTTCFNDGVRLIDFVLCYEVQDQRTEKSTQMELINAMYRLRFERALIENGFELEYEKPENCFDGKTGFVKVHAPYGLLEKLAELKSLQKPFMESDIPAERPSWWKRLIKKMCSKDPFDLQEEYRLPHTEYFTDVFERERGQEFLNSDDELAFFSSAQRIYLTWDALSNTTVKLEEKTDKAAFLMTLTNLRTETRHIRHILVPRRHEEKLGPEEDFGVPDEAYDPEDQGQEGLEDQESTEDDADDQQGVNEDNQDIFEDESEEGASERKKTTASFHFLLNMGVYKSGFPLHDGRIEDDDETERLPPSEWPLRKYLYESWARPRQWRRYQPIQAIRNYYGEKVGLYFAWIGFYTKMLIVPSIVGVLVTLYGLVSITYNDLSQATCKDSDFGELLLCPDCPTEACTFTRVKNFCNMAKLAAMFDNGATVFFAIFMSVWAICFLEFWKRYRCKLCVDWDVTDQEFDTEHVRPEYMLRAPHMKLNPVTMRLEPHLRMSTKLKRVAASLATVLFFILVVIGLLAGVMVYKVVGPTWWKHWLKRDGNKTGESERSEYGLIVSITSSLVNGIFIAIMTKIYMHIAWFLTRAEFPRTERDFEYSYTYKVFTFQCVNFYGALFYLAVLRGRSSSPPHLQSAETRCPISGCMVDVTIQLAVIMTGKQAINNVLELGLPLLRSFIKRMKRRRMQKKQGYGMDEDSVKKTLPTWQRDYQMDEHHGILLFSDYLELLIQYGFVTMFVPAFPLAPLFAFLNNVIEIRLDAYKTVVLTQRCVPLRAKNLGPWYRLLKIVTRVAVVTNGLMIAFTTQFIDRLVFKLLDHVQWGEKHTRLNGEASFLYFTLSEFRVTDYEKVNNYAFSNATETLTGPNGTALEYCYYVDHRHPPTDEYFPYQRTSVWWNVLAAKLIFVILFEHFVILFQKILAYMIPDVPKREKLRMARESHLVREKFLTREFGEKKKDHRHFGRYDSDSDSDDEQFEPDELPDWLSTKESTVNGAVHNTPKRHPENFPEDGTRVVRGKVIVTNAKRPKQPFLMMILRKLIMCD